MAKLISIPTKVTGQPNILFNTDNIATVLPPGAATVPLAAGAGSTTTITVTSTAGLLPGMIVVVTAGTGAFAFNTTVISVTNTTTFIVSAAPTTTLSAATITAYVPYCTVYSQGKNYKLSFGGSTPTLATTNAIAGFNLINNSIISASPAPVTSTVNFPSIAVSGGVGAVSQTTITVNSTSGLMPGMLVTLVGGSGVLAANTFIVSITNGTQFVISAAPTTALVVDDPATLSFTTLFINAIAVV